MNYDAAMEILDYLQRRGLHFHSWATAHTWDWAKVEAHYCALVQGTSR